MLWFIGLFILLSVLMLIMYGTGRYFYYRAFNIHSNKSSFIRNDMHKKKKAEDIWFLEKSGYQAVSVQNLNGLRLQGYCISRDKCDKWVILVHGYMGKSDDLRLEAKQFYDLGFQVLLIDLQGHGNSEGEVIGFGYLDSQDLTLWVQYLNENQSAKHILLYGVSMGAATVMMCSDQQLPNVEGVIEDCGFTNLYAQLKHIVGSMIPKLPPDLFIICLRIVLKCKAGYRINDVNPLQHVAKAQIPMMFLHGDRDTFIPCTMVDELSDAYPNKAYVKHIKGGRHANSSKLASKVYWEAITLFLKENHWIREK